MVKCLAHVCFGVSDLDRSLAFYRDKLGFRPAYDFLDDKGERIGHCLHIGGATFLEFFRSNLAPPTEGSTHSHFCLQVEDIESAAAELKRRGVEVGEIQRGSDRSFQVWLADPDGNRIELQQYTRESKQTPWLK